MASSDTTDISRIVEFARALIYASAIGIIIETAASSLSNGADDARGVGQVLPALAATCLILFLVMDGVTRYYIRESIEQRPVMLPVVSGARFVLESVGLFAFCYWASLVIYHGDLTAQSSRVYLAMFAFTSFLHNLASFQLILLRTHTHLATARHWYGVPHALKGYFLSLLIDDVFEEKFSRDGRRLTEGIKTVRIYRANILENMKAGGGEVFALGTVQAARLRLIVQTQVVHLVVLHLLVAVVLFPGVWEKLEELRPGPADAVTPEMFIPLALIFAAFLAYWFTTLCEFGRVRSRSEDPRSLELISQIIGNLALLTAILVSLAFIPLWLLYAYYFLSSLSVIKAVLVQSHNETALRTPAVASGDGGGEWSI